MKTKILKLRCSLCGKSPRKKPYMELLGAVVCFDCVVQHRDTHSEDDLMRVALDMAGLLDDDGKISKVHFC